MRVAVTMSTGMRVGLVGRRGKAKDFAKNLLGKNEKWKMDKIYPKGRKNSDSSLDPTSDQRLMEDRYVNGSVVVLWDGGFVACSCGICVLSPTLLESRRASCVLCTQMSVHCCRSILGFKVRPQHLEEYLKHQKTSEVRL